MKFKLKNNYKKFDSQGVTPVKNTPIKKKTKTMAYQKETKKNTY